MKIHLSSLMTALVCAIELREAEEKRMGYTGDSTMLAVWKELLESLRKGERVEINYSKTW